MKTVKLTTILLIVVALSLLSFFQVLAQGKGCAHDWTFSYNLDLHRGFWSDGYHDYEVEITIDGNTLPYSNGFTVTDDAPIYKGQVLFRFFGLVTAPVWTQLYEINPSQDTIFQVTWVTSDMSKKEALDTQAGTSVKIKWDDGEWLDLPKGRVVNVCTWGNPSLFKRSWGPIY